MPKRKKHAKDMTTEEALKHLFHPQIVKQMKDNLQKQNQSRIPQKRSVLTRILGIGYQSGE